MVSMSEELNQWIQKKLQEQGWSVRELGRRADLSSSYISNVLNGKREPGAKFFVGMAKAFDVTVDQIERLDVMGIDPDLVENLDDPLTYQEIMGYVKQLSNKQRIELLKYVIYLWKQERAEKRKDAPDDSPQGQTTDVKKPI